MSESRQTFWALAAATAAVLLLAYGPLLAEFFANLWERPHYQYFPFVLGAFVWLTWQRCRKASGEGRREGSEEQRAEDPHPALSQRERVVLNGPRRERDIRASGGGQGADSGRGKADGGRRKAATTALGGAWVVLGFAYLVNSPWLAYLSAICLAAALFLRVSARWYVTYLWGVWLLLWLVLPLPMGRDQQLISFLQQLSSRLSSWLLDWAGVVHLMEGNKLLVRDKEFFVDEACSGIVSVLSIIACAVIYAVWRNRPPVHLAVLAVAGVGWATLMNVVRISVIAMVYAWYGIDWSKGAPHETLGLVIFLITFLALVSTDYLLIGLLAPIKSEDGQWYGEPPRFGVWIADAWDWLQGWGRPVLAIESRVESQESRAGIGARSEGRGARSEKRGAKEEKPSCRRSNERIEDAYPHAGHLQKGEGQRSELAKRFVLGTVPLVAFAALASAQLVINSGPAPGRFGEPHNLERALAMDATALPQRCRTLDRMSFAPVEREFDNLFGNFSRTYEYRDSRGNTYLVSCDFPLEAGGHELTNCYRGIGWHMSRREVREAPSGAYSGEEQGGDSPIFPRGLGKIGIVPKWGYAEADFSKPDGGYAFLTFCAFDEHGMRVTPPTYSLWHDLWRTIQRQSLGKRVERTYQVQVWVTGPATIDEEQKQTARELLLEVRERFRKLVVGEEESRAES